MLKFISTYLRFTIDGFIKFISSHEKVNIFPKRLHNDDTLNFRYIAFYSSIDTLLHTNINKEAWLSIYMIPREFH